MGYSLGTTAGTKSPEYAPHQNMLHKCYFPVESSFEAVCVIEQKGLQRRSWESKDLFPFEQLPHDRAVDISFYVPIPNPGPHFLLPIK